MNRRTFLRGAAALPAVAAAARLARAAPPWLTRPRHHVVTIVLCGGYDTVMSVDPKAGDDARDIDPGYRADELVLGSRRRYGPLFAPLLAHEDRWTLVHGVRTDTAAHEDGLHKLFHGRALYGPTTPAVGDLLGAVLPGFAPIEHLIVAGTALPTSTRGPSTRAVGVGPEITAAIADDSFRRPFDPDPVLERARLDDAARAFAHDPAAAAEATRHLRQSYALRRLLADAPSQSPFTDEELGHRLAFALHALRRDAARAITILVRPQWLDSHADHVRFQRQRLGPIFTDVARFVDALAASPLPGGGTLLDATTIAIGSELGRFPRLNAVAGKDHWPESSWLLLGKGLRRAPGGVTLGATDASFRGRRVDFATGALDGPDARPIFVDSIFATLFACVGADPTRAGYRREEVLAHLLA